MADGTRMPPQPTTFSVGGMHLAIADGILCLRVDASTDWPKAKEHSEKTVQDGTRISEDCQYTKGEIDALGPDWAGYHHNVVRVRDGCFDGLSAVGVASNKKNRERVARMALTAACLATLKEPELQDYVVSIQMVVKELQQCRAFHVK